MQPFFLVGYSLWGGGAISGRVRALNLTVPLGSGQTISGTGRVRASVLSPCRPLVCEDIPVLAITTIFKMNRTLMTTCKYSSASTWLTSRWQYCAVTLTPVTQEEHAALKGVAHRMCSAAPCRAMSFKFEHCFL